MTVSICFKGNDIKLGTSMVIWHFCLSQVNPASLGFVPYFLCYSSVLSQNRSSQIPNFLEKILFSLGTKYSILQICL